MGYPGDILTASATEQALVERIALQEQQIVDRHAPYEPVSAIVAWFETLQFIEECMNLVTVDWDDEEFEQELFQTPAAQLLRDPNRLAEMRRRVKARFSEKFCTRFMNLLSLGTAIATSFAIHGLFDVAAGFHTVGSMVGYLESRRRHFVGLLHLLPNACCGNLTISRFDGLNIFLPVIELSAIQTIRRAECSHRKADRRQASPSRVRLGRDCDAGQSVSRAGEIANYRGANFSAGC